MDCLKLNEELEAQFTWRVNELRFFRNNIFSINKETEKDIYRKALIVMLYSHFEGFCKFCFLLYISAINNEKLKLKLLKDPIVAASLDSVFSAYENRDAKCKIFEQALPDDTKLHKFARQKDFITSMDKFLDKDVDIPEILADTESNLKPVVMRKILFRLGFKVDYFSNCDGTIYQLLKYRNAIAHGSRQDGISETEYTNIEKETIRVMEQVKYLVITSLKKQTFLKNQIS